MPGAVVQQALGNGTGVQHFEQLEMDRVLLHVLGEKIPFRGSGSAVITVSHGKGFVSISNGFLSYLPGLLVAAQLACCCEIGNDDWPLCFKCSLYLPSAIVLCKAGRVGITGSSSKEQKGLCLSLLRCLRGGINLNISFNFVRRNPICMLHRY